MKQNISTFIMGVLATLVVVMGIQLAGFQIPNIGRLPTDISTATPMPTVTPFPTVVLPTPIPTITPDVRLSPHQQCALSQTECVVNINPNLLDRVIHTTYKTRNTDIPVGYRLRIAESAPLSPVIYCKPELKGCTFEFQWLAGSYGYQVEDLVLYPDTVYMVKIAYSIKANCSQGNNCSDDQLSIGSQVFAEGNRHTLPNQSTSRIASNQERVWAIRPQGTDPMTTAIQVYLNINWATFAEPAILTIHRIEIIALPNDYRGVTIPISTHFNL